MSDFLEEPKAQPLTGLSDAVTAGFNQQSAVLADIRRELMKTNPEVLTQTIVQGGSEIAVGDKGSHKIFFEVGGKAVTVHRIIAWSVAAGSNVGLSIVPMGDSNYQDGILLDGMSPTPLILNVSVDSLYIATDGVAAVGVNKSGSTNRVWVFGFTIPDYDRQREAPLNASQTRE